LFRNTNIITKAECGSQYTAWHTVTTVQNCQSGGVTKQGYQHASCEGYGFQVTFYKRSRKVVQKFKKHCSITPVSPKRAIFVVIPNAKKKKKSTIPKYHSPELILF